MDGRAYLETLLVLGLLLVNDAETEINLVGLFKVGLHAHDLGKGLLGQLEGAISIVEDADAVPQLGILKENPVRIVCPSRINDAVSLKGKDSTRAHLEITPIVDSLLISGIGLLEVVHHQETVACNLMDAISAGSTNDDHGLNLFR